jgi:DNA-directed RNA polymerase beta subunit
MKKKGKRDCRIIKKSIQKHTSERVIITTHEQDVSYVYGGIFASRHGQKGTVFPTTRDKEAALSSVDWYHQFKREMDKSLNRETDYSILEQNGIALIGHCLKVGDILLGKTITPPTHTDKTKN